ncbi:MAG: bifunctional (p)ppGpp synthetase/guanosine-3',5'-bis(diphosphate) 3'-pyrophosphohydrolase [Clostridia bacterium]|nr:bifunctional (p)ppGpp synthetase/guanosine-3',5'-bis(diphosphate) 3'-pyrophosphohydrolase [Clostridia bacterium]
MEEYVRQLLDYNPNYDAQLLEKAYLTAEKHHEGQLRKSGEPYIIHPMAVGRILAELGMDEVTIAGGILHDIVEDTDYTLADVEMDFGPQIAALVDGVTKLTNINYETKEEQQAENIRKMFLAMSKDIRVLIIKLADRLHNLRTINYQTPKKIREKCQESLDIYAPLAARLGIYKFKFEMEDISFKNLEPEAYEKLDREMKARQVRRQNVIDEVIRDIRKVLEGTGIEYEIYGRQKHYYSIYKKMQYQNKQLDEIFDLTAVRIIVDTVKDCYGVLGAVHTMWTPIPGRFKDYIAMPKPNRYQSLHTTVIGRSGNPFEIQIRTKEMHQVAEYGIAAHWKYKEGIASDDEEVKLAWLRQTLEWQQELKDPGEFMETVKVDLFSNQVFVFTPKGDVMELPAGSTPLDFAFKVHTAVGCKCVGAKVNGKMVPIDYELQNGEIVDIVTSANSRGPNLDWLKIVKTNSAKNKIRQYLKRQAKEQTPEKTAAEKAREAREEAAREAARAEAEAKRKAEEEAKKLAAAMKRGPEKTKGVSVKGVGDLLIHFAKCCSPVPGDSIIGYTTKGRGISIHRMDCSNIRALPEVEKLRLIDVSWDTEGGGDFDAAITIIAEDRKGLFSDVSKICLDMDMNINGLTLKKDKAGVCTMDLTLSINNTGDIIKVLSKMKQVKGVREVYRAGA